MSGGDWYCGAIVTAGGSDTARVPGRGGQYHDWHGGLQLAGFPMCGFVLLGELYQDLLFLCRAEQSDVLVLCVEVGRLPAVNE